MYKTTSLPSFSSLLAVAFIAAALAAAASGPPAPTLISPAERSRRSDAGRTLMVGGDRSKRHRRV
jgi:hypothetical protein